jgi:hypothetical protein
MTKHASGKYGRTIGQKERTAGWPSPATAWCFMCNGTHRWAEGCVAAGGHPAFSQREDRVTTRRATGRTAA